MTEIIRKNRTDILAGDIDSRADISYALQLHGRTIEKWMIWPRLLQIDYGVFPLIAGGCIRDLLFNKVVSSIDVFITCSQNLPVKKLYEQIIKDKGCGEASDINIRALNAYHAGTVKIDEIDLPYNLIFLRESKAGAEIIHSFDYGLCQIGVNVYGMSLIAHAFVQDCAGKTLTLLHDHSEGDVELKNRRKDKLLAKFPLFQYVDTTSSIILP